MDVKNKCWSKEMMEICHVSREQLPDLYESYEVVGTLKEEIAAELGLSSEVKIIASRRQTRRQPSEQERSVQTIAISRSEQAERFCFK